MLQSGIDIQCSSVHTQVVTALHSLIPLPWQNWWHSHEIFRSEFKSAESTPILLYPSNQTSRILHLRYSWPAHPFWSFLSATEFRSGPPKPAELGESAVNPAFSFQPNQMLSYPFTTGDKKVVPRTRKTCSTYNFRSTCISQIWKIIKNKRKCN